MVWKKNKMNVTLGKIRAIITDELSLISTVFLTFSEKANQLNAVFRIESFLVQKEKEIWQTLIPGYVSRFGSIGLYF